MRTCLARSVPRPTELSHLLGAASPRCRKAPNCSQPWASIPRARGVAFFGSGAENKLNHVFSRRARRRAEVKNTDSYLGPSVTSSAFAPPQIYWQKKLTGRAGAVAKGWLQRTRRESAVERGASCGVSRRSIYAALVALRILAKRLLNMNAEPRAPHRFASWILSGDRAFCFRPNSPLFFSIAPSLFHLRLASKNCTLC